MKPPVLRQVQQNLAVLPDGNVDPAGQTDCGEACVCSLVASRRGYMFSPGAIRQALGLPSVNGRTTTDELVGIIRGFGLTAGAFAEQASVTRDTFTRWIAKGYYVVFLSSMYGTDALHWLVAYDFSSQGVTVMDPEMASPLTITYKDLERFWAGEVIVNYGVVKKR
jgi:hypothetical protein